LKIGTNFVKVNLAFKVCVTQNHVFFGADGTEIV